MTAPPPRTYEISATYLLANIKAIRELGFYDAWFGSLSDDLKEIVASPNRQNWWPGAVNERVLRALADRCGEPAVEAVGFTSVHRSIGPIVLPLLKVLLTMTSSDPNTIFSRLGQFSSTSSRGVEITWRPIDATHGEATIRYNARTEPVMKALWRGGLRSGFSLLNRQGAVDAATQSVDGRALTFLLSWK